MFEYRTENIIDYITNSLHTNQISLNLSVLCVVSGLFKNGDLSQETFVNSGCTGVEVHHDPSSVLHVSRNLHDLCKPINCGVRFQVSIVITKSNEGISRQGTIQHLELDILVPGTVDSSEGSVAVKVERIVIIGIHGMRFDVVLQ